MNSSTVDFRAVQGIVRFGYRRLTEASFLLLRIEDANAARAWLGGAPVSDAVARDAAPLTALQIGFTRQGLQALGLRQDVLSGFSLEFLGGLAEDAGRSRLLGDLGANEPAHWDWGYADETPHLLLMLYAQPGHLDGWMRAVQGAQWERAFRVIACLTTSDLHGFEPFGFMDSLSQPAVDWNAQERTVSEQLTYTNVISLGEVLLGYPNEYGRYTDRPFVSASDPLSAVLPEVDGRPDLRDLGRDGCYLVLRTLEQDVRGFWQFVNAAESGEAEARDALAAAMVGRRRDGTPLVPLQENPIAGVDAIDAAQNQFTFDSDPQGLRCPFGAHIRRTNPRNADLPTPAVYGFEKALRVVGLGRQNLYSDAKASVRFHRIVRRGREYGSALSVEQALASGGEDGPHGIHFVALMANIARQFEFLQSAWMMNSKFNAMTDENDPLLGNREPVAGAITDTFSRPRANRPRDRVCALPQFIRVRGGAYFFLPSLPALRYLSGLDGIA